MSTETTAPKVLSHLRLANEVSRRFQDYLEKDAADAAAVQAAVPEAVDALEANERIFGHQKEAVAEKLASSHLACLELIRDLANHRNAAELDAIGTPVGQEKQSAARPVTGAPVGDWDETPEGQAFRNKLTGQ